MSILADFLINVGVCLAISGAGSYYSYRRGYRHGYRDGRPSMCCGCECHCLRPLTFEGAMAQHVGTLHGTAWDETVELRTLVCPDCFVGNHQGG